MKVTFTVPMQPEPKGSVSAYPYKKMDGSYGARVVHSPRAMEFEGVVSLMAGVAMRAAGLDMMEDCAVDVHIDFYLDKGKSVKRPRPWVKPDLDKLLRAAKDGMTGLVYKDDAQVCHVDAWKMYAAPGRDPSAVVRVMTLE